MICLFWQKKDDLLFTASEIHDLVKQKSITEIVEFVKKMI